MSSNILVIGASGQIGSELVVNLRERYGSNSVIATDIRQNDNLESDSGIFEILDAKDFDAVKTCIKKYNVKTVYLMAALLSAKGEQYPEKAWNLNMTSLFNVLNLAKEGVIDKIFWPSSIAVFGPTTPRDNTPQHTTMEPNTVYGITKQVGERWCEYYHYKYDVDVRSIRYPGIISWKTMPGGGTTDYAVEIYHKAVTDGYYDCFLNKSSELPMMFMEDAIRATLMLMDAPQEDIKLRSSYNIAAISFTPSDVVNSIKKFIPEFQVAYNPDFRQAIADSWPSSIDDSVARKDWNWKPKYNLDDISEIMIRQLMKKYHPENSL